MLYDSLIQLLKEAFSAVFLAGYITNSQSFPHPLTAEEEQKYLELFKQGSEEARNILIERNLRLVAHIAKKYNTGGVDCDDMISIGTIGLIKAIGSFNADKGIRLATYAARCIDNEILMYLRTTKKFQHEISLHEPIGTDREGNELPSSGYQYCKVSLYELLWAPTASTQCNNMITLPPLYYFCSSKTQ